MFALKKLIAPFLLPPGIFVFILVGYGFWCCRRRRYGAGLVTLLLGAFLWLLATAPVGSLLMRGLEGRLTIPRPLRGDVIILLGGGINGFVPDLTGTGTPSEDMNGRLLTAVRAQRQLGVPVIVSGGAVFAGQPAEAPVVRRFLLDLGVPAEQVIVEAQSRDTMENARYCREIINRSGFRQPLLVTSAYHMPRSLAAFRKAGVTVTPLPAQFATGGGEPFLWVHWLPEAGALHRSSKALHEYLGLLWYRLSG